jgi:hypothetical protein
VLVGTVESPPGVTAEAFRDHEGLSHAGSP